MPASIFYLIRHGEKPGGDADGLSPQGETRAQGLRRVFGVDSGCNIQFIIAKQPKPDGSRERPYETFELLAQDLGLTVDTSVKRNDAEGAAAEIKAYPGPGNILVCWEHGVLAHIAKEVGVKKFAKTSGWDGDRHKIEYPGDRFDLIWELPAPYDEITEVRSESIPGLDDKK